MLSVSLFLISMSLSVEEIDHYSVRKFQSLGITESHFVDSYLTNFRYTLYVQKKTIHDTKCIPKPRLTPAIFMDTTISTQVFVNDRLGSMGASLAPLIESAKAGHFGQLGFAPYAMNQKFALDHIIPPAIAPSLAMLTQTPSLHDLYYTAVSFPHKRPDDNGDPAIIAKALSDMLNFLASINTLSFVRRDGPLFVCDASTMEQHGKQHVDKKTPNKAAVPPTATKPKELSKELEIQAERMRELGFDEDFIKESLLGEDASHDSEEEVNTESTTDNDATDSCHVSGTCSTTQESSTSVIDSDDIAETEEQIKSKLSSILKLLHEKTDNPPTLSTTGKPRNALNSIEKLRNVATAGAAGNANHKNKLEEQSKQHVELLLKHSEQSNEIILNFKSSNTNAHKMYRSLNCFQR